VGRPDAAAVCDAEPGWFLEFLAADGVKRRCALASCLEEPFEDVLPVRSFHFEKGAVSFAGFRWFATTDRHVGYESWLERDHLKLMDFDPRVAAVSSQPFWLHWRDETGRARRHAPDFFVRRTAGSALVVDVRPDDRIAGKDTEAFAAMAEVCRLAGWEFARVGEIAPVVMANVTWLSWYRHHRNAPSEVVRLALLAAFGDGAPLLEGAAAVGDRLSVLPRLYHLMWCGELVADLSTGPLDRSTMVRLGGLR
jgi:hypothetical protein